MGQNLEPQSTSASELKNAPVRDNPSFKDTSLTKDNSPLRDNAPTPSDQNRFGGVTNSGVRSPNLPGRERDPVLPVLPSAAFWADINKLTACIIDVYRLDPDAAQEIINFANQKRADSYAKLA